MMNRYHILWLIASALLIAACSSDSLVEKEETPVVVDEGLPMVFGSSSAPATTRSSTPLEALHDHFKVSVWKSYGQTAQQTVMDEYRVNYEAATASTPAQWNYVDVVVGSKTQVQRYWDLGNFPYEFRAVSPYLSGVTIGSDKITISVPDQPFTAQTLINDVYNVTDEESEPCVVAHVSRQNVSGNFVDTDLIKAEEINDASKTVPTREVLMPFHHLISKIGFHIYLDDPQPTLLDYVAKLNSIKISAVKSGFISKSETYTATTTQGLSSGTFSDNTTADEFVLLQHGLYQVLDDNNNLVDLNLRNYLSKDQTFDLCPSYLQQIPQELKIRVQLQILAVSTTDPTNVETINFDKMLSINRTNVLGDDFTWEPEKRYIYYLHIPNLQEHEIYLKTCEILPWDEVQSSDIPIEL